MAQYRTGTVAVTNGDQTVTGTDTLWLTEVQAGDWFRKTGDLVSYTVASVTSNTELELTANYAGTTGSGSGYQITRDFTDGLGLPLLTSGDRGTDVLWNRAMQIMDDSSLGAFESLLTDEINEKNLDAGVTIEGVLIKDKGITVAAGETEAFTIDWYDNVTDSAIGGLTGGTTFGGIIRAPNLGHFVIGIRDDEVTDSFSIISGGGNFSGDVTYDKLVARFKADGNTTLGGSVDVAGDVNVAGDLSIAEFINRTGDLDTRLWFLNNRLILEAGGNRFFDAQSGGLSLDNAGLGSTFGGDVVAQNASSGETRFIADNTGTGNANFRWRIDGSTKANAGVDRVDGNKFKLAPSQIGVSDWLVLDPSDLSATFAGAIVATRSSTIASTNLANAAILVGTAAAGLGMDANEIRVSGGDMFIGPTGANDLHVQAASGQDVAIFSGADFSTTLVGRLVANGGAKLGVQNLVDGGSERGIFLWDTNNTAWGIYMAQAGAAKSLGDGTACESIDSRTTHHIRHRVASNATGGFLWENNAEQCLMSLTADTGDLYTKGVVRASGSANSNVAFGFFQSGTSGLGWTGSAPAIYDSSTLVASFDGDNGVTVASQLAVPVVNVGASVDSEGALNVRGDGTAPSLTLQGTARDIGVPTGNNLQVGHWDDDTSTWTERFTIDANGNFDFKDGNLVTAGQATIGDIVSTASGMWKGTDTSSLRLSGGSSTELGGNIVMYGEGHANANDILFRSGTTPRLRWNDSATQWEFGTQIMSGVSDIRRGTTTGAMYLSGGSSLNNGANIALHGESHGADPNDIYLRTGSTNRLAWDDTEGWWHFNSNQLNFVPSITRGSATDLLTFSGGSSTSAGASMELFGQSHATTPNDIVLKTNGVEKVRWDDSASRFKVSGEVALGVGASIYLNSTINDFVGVEIDSPTANFFCGSQSSFEPRLLLYGPSNGQSNAGGVLIATGVGSSGIIELDGPVKATETLEIGELLQLTEITVEPSSPVDGMIVYADGTTWDPGSGEGVYARVAGSWVKMA